MRITHSADPRAPAAGRARYRVDFFVRVQRSGARPRDEGPIVWWLVEQVHIDEAEVSEVLAWAEREVDTEGRYVVYLEQSVIREGEEVTVTSRLAGADPRTV